MNNIVHVISVAVPQRQPLLFVWKGKKYANKVVKNVYCCILTPFDIMTVQNESILSCNETDKLCKNCL